MAPSHQTFKKTFLKTVLFIDPRDATAYTEHLLLLAGGGDGLLRALLQHQEHWRQHLRLQLCVRLRRDRRLRPHYPRSKELAKLEELMLFYRRCQDLITEYRRSFVVGSDQLRQRKCAKKTECTYSSGLQSSIDCYAGAQTIAMTTAISSSPCVNT